MKIHGGQNLGKFRSVPAAAGRYDAPIIFEKSAFATEVGAALAVTPNGARVLSSLGFSFERARACQIKTWNSLLGIDLKCVGSNDLSKAERMFGAAAWAVHRIDLHSELLRLATATDVGDSKPAVLRLSSQVIEATPAGWVTIFDGSKHQADLIIGADGLHSILCESAAPVENQKPSPSGMSAFRFLIDTQTLLDDEHLTTMLNKKSPDDAAILIDPTEKVLERHIMWYPCRKITSGEVQNFVGIHPTQPADYEDGESPGESSYHLPAGSIASNVLNSPSAPSTDMKKLMVEEFGHFDPGIIRVINKSMHVKRWPLYVHQPLPTWHNGRIVLIGDAAHPMLPFGGQGSNQAMEDAAALGHLLTNVTDPAAIEKRLWLFEKVRKNRATRVQILSKARVGREKEVEEELKAYAEPAGSPVTICDKYCEHL
ncbi:MAG: hypothetical protein Q9186_006093 [Xanthomendoza sp. 1 TL-2023]